MKSGLIIRICGAGAFIEAEQINEFSDTNTDLKRFELLKLILPQLMQIPHLYCTLELNTERLTRQQILEIKRQLSYLSGNFEWNDVQYQVHTSLWQRLTPREREIFPHLCKGLSDGDIAILFELSAGTIHDYRRSIKQKAGVHKSSELWKFLENTSHKNGITLP